MQKPDWIVPIVRVVGTFCNLRCTYCYQQGPAQSQPQIMDDQVLRRLIQEVLTFGDTSKPVYFSWHGGEPLLAGREFFERVVYYQALFNQHGRKIVNAVQTNGTLLDEEWAQWFAKHRFQVGVSIDGTPQLHDKYRQDIGGKGTWKKAVRAFHLLRKHGVKGGALVVVHSEAAHQGKKIVHSLYANGIRAFGFNPYFEAHHQRNHSFQGHLFVDSEYYARFWSDVIDAWLEINDEALVIREIDEVMKIVMGVQPDFCILNGTCHHYLTIHPNGDVYPCDKIPSTQEVRFGNILQDSLDTILSTKKYQAFVRKIQVRPTKCISCPLSTFCNNGCTHHRRANEYIYCDAYRLIFERILMCLEDHHEDEGFTYPGQG